MLMEIGTAVFGGGLLYGSKKTVIDPIREYRRIRKEISKDLVNYANVISNPGSSKQDRIDEARKILRGDASELKSVVDDIPMYDLWAALRLVPSRGDVEEAKKNLIGLSNSVDSGDPLRNHDMRKTVESSLGLMG